MKKIIPIILAFLFTVGLNAQSSEHRNLEEFNSIVSYDGISVQLVPSDHFAVKISGDKIDQCITQVSKGTLKLKMNIGNNFKGQDIHAIVYYKEKLDMIKACEGSSITSNHLIKSDKLELVSKEGAEINLKLKVLDLIAGSFTGGLINISGSSENVNIDVATGGQYEGKDFHSKHADAKINAGGKVEVNVSEELDAAVSMGGNIYYYGETKTVNSKINFGGTIESR